MKYLTLALLVLGLTLAGCTSYPNLDREFGQATRTSLKRQVAFPADSHVRKVPEGMGGISAEEVMDTYNQTYAEKWQKTDAYSFQFGPGNGGGR